MRRSRVSYQSRAVVTGAGSGIGKAFAVEVHRRNGAVVCADINAGSAEQTADFIRAQGGRALAVQCDVADLASVELLSEKAAAWFGQSPNLIVNNAGVGVGGQCVEDIPMEDWRWIMGVNLWGVIHGCRVFMPQLKAQHFGGIINVASAASFGAAPLMGSYNATKSAVVALTETMHGEASSQGVHVTALCPTFVKTNVIQNARMSVQFGRSTMSRSKAQSLMDKLGHTPESVVVKAFNGLDKNKVHVLPQIDARIAWLLKRLAPSQFVRLSSKMASQLQQ